MNDKTDPLDGKPADIIEFDNLKKKPRKIEKVLPWPPSEGLMKEMEQGLVTEASFAIQVVIKGDDPSHEDVMKRIESKRQL